MVGRGRRDDRDPTASGLNASSRWPGSGESRPYRQSDDPAAVVPGGGAEAVSRAHATDQRPSLASGATTLQ